jgi:poly-gamma-glutamate biosynthesis protein PgsC/CapC
VDILITLGVAITTYFCLRLLASIIIIYGKRRTAFAILFGYVIGTIVRSGLDIPSIGSAEIDVIGYIIPGLIALWMDRQGIAETITSLATVAAVVRLLLILLVPAQLQEFEHGLAPEPAEVQEFNDLEQYRED